METSDDRHRNFVPIGGHSLFTLLASEIARSAAYDTINDLIVLVDSKTAKHVNNVDAVRANAGQVFLLGTIPEEWTDISNITQFDINGKMTDEDRFLIVISPTVHLAILGREIPVKATPGQDEFEGGWTAKKSHVYKIARTILDCFEVDASALLPDYEQADIPEFSLDCAMHLTGLLTQQLTAIQRNMAKDRDDLVSVLNILKAISTKRRAHDILYVFVDQIASIVTMSRCSVVRVWGHETKGHVLASHEDKDVKDIKINLDKYPEIYRSMETGGKVVINDVHSNPLTRKFSDEFTEADITAILVIPIVLFDQNVGSFFLRAARNSGEFSLRETSFCEIVAEAAANALERAHLFESIQKANERLEHLAITDGLTGLFNHRHFRERLEDEFERAKRYSLPLSCLIMDIDDFKKLNDTYGHLAGDNVLREISERTSQSVRKSDIVARYGGEEFVVIMPQTGIEGVKSEAERIRKNIADSPFTGLSSDVHTTVSVGIAVLDHDNMLDCEALIRVADSALYESKSKGKNCVTVGSLEGETS